MDGLLLLSILLAQGISTQAQAELQVDASLAFAGYVNNDGFSELRVRAFSRVGGKLVLQTRGTTHDVRLSLELLPDQPADAWLPLRINSFGEPAALRAQLGQFDYQDISLAHLQRSMPPFALVGSHASQLLGHLPDTISIGPTALPHIPEAYGQVSALAIDRQAMAALDEDQLRALLDYVGTCGRLLLLDVSNAVGQVLANRASCEGQFLTLASDDESASDAFVVLLEKSEFLLPSNRDIEALLGDSLAEKIDLNRVILLWGGYLFVLVLLLTRTRYAWAAMGFSMVSTVLVIIVWPSGTSREFVAWAEMASSEKMARYVGIERHSASRRGAVLLTGVGYKGYPAGASDGDFLIDRSPSGERRRIAWNAAPFEQLDQYTQGSFPVDTTVQLFAGSTSAGVCNVGNSATTPMYLHWQGRVYEVPSLVAGARWTSSSSVALGAEIRGRPELKLFVDRSARHSMTVLQSLPVPDAEGTERAWLMRYQSHRVGGSPCAS